MLGRRLPAESAVAGRTFGRLASSRANHRRQFHWAAGRTILCQQSTSVNSLSKSTDSGRSSLPYVEAVIVDSLGVRLRPGPSDPCHYILHAVAVASVTTSQENRGSTWHRGRSLAVVRRHRPDSGTTRPLPSVCRRVLENGSSGTLTFDARRESPPYPSYCSVVRYTLPIS